MTFPWAAYDVSKSGELLKRVSAGVDDVRLPDQFLRSVVFLGLPKPSRTGESTIDYGGTAFLFKAARHIEEGRLFLVTVRSTPGVLH